MLLATAVIALALGGLLSWSIALDLPAPEQRLGRLLLYIPLTTPLWLPIVFATSAVCRKALTVRMVFVFAVCQAIGVGVAYLASLIDRHI
jgi:hypothetical protein